MVRRLAKHGILLLLSVFFCACGLTCAGQPVKVLGTGRFIPADSVVLVAAGPQYAKSWFHQVLFGKHYRRVWAEPIYAQLFDIRRNMGGFIPLQMGGSFQTKNLRLEDSLGKEFVIRSVDKDPTQKLSRRLQNSFIAGMVRDQTSVIHPYGYYIVPKLSDAAGVYHTNPRLVFIPDDPELGEFREAFANMLAMVEERPTGNRKEVNSFGNPAKVASSRSAFAKIYSDPCHQVDDRHFLKSRLFDVWIGDWSRREDQWRWAVFKSDTSTIYRGIPRDRDHAFFLLDDGLITWLFTRFQTDIQSFHHRIKNVEGYTRAGRQMDAFFLNYLTKEDFVTTAKVLEQALTDDVIDEALSVWPENIYRLSGKEFRSKLLARRAQLPRVAAEFYKILAKEVNLPGSDKKDRFLIERLSNGDVKVVLYNTDKDCSAGTVLGERVFSRKETKLIRIYGLGGNDEVTITGSGGKGIKLEIKGGEGRDKISNLASSRSPERFTKIYDPDDGDEITKGKREKIVEDYTPLAEEYNATGWLLRHRLY